MTLREALERASAVLKEAGVPDASRDAFLLLNHVTGINHAVYLAEPDVPMSPEAEARYTELIERRRERIPLQHIIGTQEFMGLEFKVDGSVLIPRADTETLVEAALEKAGEMIAQGDCESAGRFTVLDIGTGSGCILISLIYYLKERGPCFGTGADIMPEALGTARANADACGVSGQTEWIGSDLFSGLDGRVFDMIVSNPPYIPTGDIEGLEPEVSRFDPRTALDGGEDGLDFYRRIIPEAAHHLTEGGWLLTEVGYGQSGDAALIFEENGYENVGVINDLAGIGRVVAGQRPQ